MHLPPHHPDRPVLPRSYREAGTAGRAEWARRVDPIVDCLQTALGDPAGELLEWKWKDCGAVRICMRHDGPVVCFDAGDAPAGPIVFTEVQSPEQCRVLAEYCAHHCRPPSPPSPPATSPS